MFYLFVVKLLCRCIWVEYDGKGENMTRIFRGVSELSFRVGQIVYCLAS